MKNLINKIKNEQGKIDLNKIKELFSKENMEEYINKLKETFSKEKINAFVEKLKSIRPEDVKLWYYSHQNIILSVLFSISLIVLLLIGISLGIKTYKTYEKLQSNIQNLSIVTNNNIISLVKSNTLRIPTGVINDLYILKYKSYNQKQYEKFYRLMLLNLVKFVSTQPSKIDMLYTELNLSGSALTSKEELNKIIVFIKQTQFNKLASVFDDSLTLRKFLSSFPQIPVSKVKLVIKDNNLAKLISQVLPKLYVYELPAIKKYVAKKADFYKQKYENNVAPYNNFLTYIFLPSFNIWIDKFSGVINPDIFGSQYLSKADYIDLNIIKYWSNFFTYSYKGKLYQGEKNTINQIKLSKINLIPEKSLASIGLNIDFSLNSEASFYGLISKLTLTSNVKNIMLLNEFTFYLWNQIKDYVLNTLPKNFEPSLPLGTRWIVYQYYNCAKANSLNCLKLFGCKTNTCLNSDIKKAVANLEKLSKTVDILGLYTNLKKLLAHNKNYDFNNSSFAKFIKQEYYKINDINKLIGSRLYDCIKENGYCGDIFDKNYSQIANAIKLFAGCDLKTNLYNDITCKYNFINKFDTNYFVGYTMVDRLGQIDYPLINRLKDVYNNIPAVLQLGKYMFSKPENPDALANYIAKIGINIFYKYITQDDYSKILSYIGKTSCKLVTNNSSFDLGKAYNYVSQRYLALSQSDADANTLYELRQLKNLIQDLQKQSQKQPLLDKLLANLEVYRIFKNRGYCQ